MSSAAPALEGPSVSIVDLLKGNTSSPPTSPRSVQAMKQCGCKPSDVAAVTDAAIVSEARRSGRTGKLNDAETAVVRKHLEHKRNAVIWAVCAERDSLLQAEATRKRIEQELIRREAISTQEAPAPSSGSAAATMAAKERKRMTELREKLAADMEAALRAELKTAAFIAQKAEEAKQAEQAETARRKDIELERQRAIEARRKEADAKAQKEAGNLAAAEARQRAWYVKELKRQAELQEAAAILKAKNAAAARSKAKAVAQQRLQAEARVEEEAAAAQARSAFVEHRQEELLAKLEAKRLAQRAEIERKAKLAGQRVNNALKIAEERKQAQRRKFMDSLAMAEARRKAREQEIQEGLARRARVRAIHEKEAEVRVNKTRADIERWRDDLVKFEHLRSQAIIRVRAERDEEARVSLLAADLRQIAKQEAVRRQQLKRLARNRQLREEMELKQARNRALQRDRARMQAQVDANARKLLVEKHAMLHETDMLLVTKKDGKARKKRTQAEADLEEAA